MTFCAAKLNLGSASETRWSVMICGVVVNTSATWTRPLLSAARVIGPDSSSGSKDLKGRPWVAWGPGRPSVRVLNSGGAPSTQPLAYFLRSAIVLRWYLAAVAAVTVIESESWAGAGVRISRLDGSLAVSAASTASVVLAVEDGLTSPESSAPLYSGKMVIAPLTTCG